MLGAALITAVLIAALVLRRRPEPSKPDGTRILAEDVADMVSTHEADGTFRYVSPVFAGLVGEYPGTLVGKNPSLFAHPDDAAPLSGLWRRALQGSGSSATLPWRCRRHNGEYAWLETTARASTRDAAELGAIVCGSRDITERKQIEDALRESEQRFRSAVETVRLVAVGLDVTGRVTFCNDALLALTGWTRADLIGESWFDRCVPPGDPARDAFHENITGGTIPPKLEHDIVCKDGRRRLIEWDNTVLHSPGGDVAGTASLGADVTERRQEEAALKLLQSITVQLSAAGDLDAALALTLESLCSATGWGYGEVWMLDPQGERIGRTTYYAAPGANAEPLIELGSSVTYKMGAGLPGRAWSRKAVDWIPDLSKVPAGRSERLHLAAQAGFQTTVAVPVLSGDEVVAILNFFMDHPRLTDERHTQMIVVVANQVGSIIERRRAQKQYEVEILRARDDAQAASRAKSEFLSRMSHELRTPLNSVIGFANVLRKNKSARLTPDELVFLDRIASNGQHLLALVNNVLDIAKVEAGRLTVTTGLVNVDQLLLDVVAQLDGQPRDPGVQLRADVPADMIPIVSDGVLMRQVLINLTGNALRFTHQGSVVLSAEIDAPTGQPTRIHVTDTGIGVPEERQAAIFEPFEQAEADTHRTYGGTGLGLSISQAICDALGYRLTLVSRVGEGSRFTVHLDASAPEPNQELDSAQVTAR